MKRLVESQFKDMDNNICYQLSGPDKELISLASRCRDMLFLHWSTIYDRKIEKSMLT